MSQKIDILIAKKIANEASEEELLQLEILLAASKQTDYQIQLIKKVWDSPSKFEERNLSLEAKWANLEKRLKVPPESSSFQLKFSKNIKLIAVTIAAVAAAAAFILVFFTNEQNDSAAITTIFSPRGTVRTIKLSDGSKITLNSGSSITYKNSFDRKHRQLMLSGEAFFNVVKDSSNPFEIITTAMKVRVLGTSFNLRSFPGETTSEVSLVTGKIELTIFQNPDKKIILTPQQKLTIINPLANNTTDSNLEKVSLPAIKFSQIHKSKIDSLPSEAMWMENWIVFDGLELREVTKMMERKYNVVIIFKNPAIETIRITGKFKNVGIDKALEQLSLITKFKYQFNETQIIIK